MNKFFTSCDKLKPYYNIADKWVLLICKILLIIDILITIYAVLGRFTFVKNYVPFISDAAWTEEVVLTCMAYMAVLSASLAIRRNTHIRMTAFDKYLPPKVIIALDLLADVSIIILAVIMMIVGFNYASNIGARGTYVSLPSVSRFWMYFPIPLAGLAMFIFELESIYNNLKKWVYGEEVTECQ